LVGRAGGCGRQKGVGEAADLGRLFVDGGVASVLLVKAGGSRSREPMIEDGEQNEDRRLG